MTLPVLLGRAGVTAEIIGRLANDSLRGDVKRWALWVDCRRKMETETSN